MKSIPAAEYEKELKAGQVDCLSFNMTCEDISTIKIKFYDLSLKIYLKW